MSTPTIETARPARPWGIAAALCILAAAALWFIQQAARQYSVYDDRYFAYAAGLFMLGSAWVLTTGMAYAAIRKRAIERHREWMLRSYTVTFAFVLFRLVDQLLIHWHVAPADQIDAMTAWACWSVPLLLVEPLLQLRRTRLGVSR
jgi:hypothetical protein